MSHSGIYNLCAKPRHNAKRNRCRGFLDARPGRVERKEKSWHPRGSFSSHKVKLAKDFVELAEKTGRAKVRRYHGDAMAKTPVWIPARRGGKVGFMMRGEKAPSRVTPSIKVADHDFPLDKRTTLALTGKELPLPSDLV